MCVAVYGCTNSLNHILDQCHSVCETHPQRLRVSSDEANPSDLSSLSDSLTLEDGESQQSQSHIKQVPLPPSLKDHHTVQSILNCFLLHGFRWSIGWPEATLPLSAGHGPAQSLRKSGCSVLHRQTGLHQWPVTGLQPVRQLQSCDTAENYWVFHPK